MRPWKGNDWQEWIESVGEEGEDFLKDVENCCRNSEMLCAIVYALADGIDLKESLRQIQAEHGGDNA